MEPSWYDLSGTRDRLTFGDMSHTDYDVERAKDITTVDVVYEDDELLVVNKPYDVTMTLKHGPTPERPMSMETLVRSYLPALGAMRFCHQLDYSTSGVLTVAKDKKMATRVCQCFEFRRAEKVYSALVFGHLSTPGSTVEVRCCSPPSP